MTGTFYLPGIALQGGSFGGICAALGALVIAMALTFFRSKRSHWVLAAICIIGLSIGGTAYAQASNPSTPSWIRSDITTSLIAFFGGGLLFYAGKRAAGSRINTSRLLWACVIPGAAGVIAFFVARESGLSVPFSAGISANASVLGGEAYLRTFGPKETPVPQREKDPGE